MENYHNIFNPNSSKLFDYENFDKLEDLKLRNYTDYAEDINISDNTDYVEDIDISDNTAFAEVSMSNDPLINEFIRNDDRLRWIPYEELTSIEHLANGGFGVVSKAKWKSKEVALKSLNNSKHLTADILQEITQHQRFDHQVKIIYVVQCYGISQDPTTENYLMVMLYYNCGNLRQYLNSHYNQLSLKDKLGLLYSTINGLYHIHAQGLIHKDFHPGNILNKHSRALGRVGCYITDLGLCKPVDEANNGKKIYGVLPYIAPEVLKGGQYTQASDIYSFGMVAYEVLSGLPPYYNVPHNISLTIGICNGLRPNLDVAGIPQLLKALIVECWDDNPLLRPKADHLRDYFRTCFTNIDWNLEFRKQYKVAEELLTSNNPTYQTHPQAIYTSRLLDLNSKETDFYISEKFSGLDITNNV